MPCKLYALAPPVFEENPKKYKKTLDKFEK